MLNHSKTLAGIDNLILVFKQKQNTQMSLQHTIKGKDDIRKRKLPDFKTQDKALVIGTVRYQLNHKQMDRWNTTESPEIDSNKCSN